MSLATKTFHSAAWNLSTNVGTRIVTVVGTLFLTRYLAPEAYGEVMVASTLTLSVNQLVNLGVGHYVAAKPSASRDVVFHATAYYLATGVVAILALIAVRNSIGAMFGAPQMGRFIPGLALATLLDRIEFMPEKVLTREMRFRRISLIRAGGELAYSVFSLAFAVGGWGGFAVVAGSIARSLLRAVAMIGSAERRDWLSPCRFDRRITSDLFAFAIPMWLASALGFAGRRWDNLLVAALYGPAPAGFYSLAYNFAEIPAIQVGEQVGDVLLPSFAQLPPARRPEALLRSMGLLALIIFPMAVGLGAVAPTLVAAVLRPEWHPIGAMLAVLSVLSIAKPIGLSVMSYLQAQNRPSAVLKLEFLMLAMVLALIATLGRFGILWVCAAAGASSIVYCLASVWMVNRLDGLSFTRVLAVLSGPLSACIPMVVAVLLVRAALQGADSRPGIQLAIEIAAGAATYVAAAFLLTPALVREMLRLASDAAGMRAVANRPR